MTYVLIVIALILLYGVFCLRRLNDNFATWATYNIKRKK